MRLFVVLLSFVIPAGVVFAQAELGIDGVVVDDSTGAPVSYANVVLEGTPLGTTTDQRGHFELKGLLPGRYELVVEHLAYAPSTVVVTVGTEITESLRIRLKPRVLLLRSVQIVATTGATGANEVFISREDIERSGASTLGELLRAVPGVEVQPSATGTRIVLRGGKGEQVLVLLDGIPLNDPLLGSADVVNLPLQWIQSVKIVKGTASAKYGGGAVAGVVELKMRRATESGNSLNAVAGSYGFRNVGPRVELSNRLHGVSFSVSEMKWDGRYRYEYEIGSERRSDVRVNADYRTDLAGLNWWSDLGGAWRVRGFLNYQRSERGIPGSIFALSPFARSWREQGLFSTLLERRRLVSTVRFQIAARLSATNFRNRVPPDAPVRFRSVPSYDTRAISQDLRFRGEWSCSSSRLGRREAGGEMHWLRYRDWDFLAGGRGPVGQVVTVGFAAWAGWRKPYNLCGSWVAVPSAEVRLDWAQTSSARVSKRSDRIINPALSVEVSRVEGNGLSIQASVGRAFRLPTYGDLFYQEYRVRGNPGLRPERAWEVSTGLTGRHRLKRLHFNWQFVHFRRDVQDQIIWRLGNFASFSPVNVDARFSGEELTAALSPDTGAWEVNLSLEWLRTENLLSDPTVQGKALPFRPDYRWKIGLDRKLGPASFSWTRVVTGPRWVTEANTVRLPGFRLDDVVVRVESTWKSLDWQIALSVYNIFDRRYEVLENAPQPGREWRLSLTLGREGTH